MNPPLPYFITLGHLYYVINIKKAAHNWSDVTALCFLSSGEILSNFYILYRRTNLNQNAFHLPHRQPIQRYSSRSRRYARYSVQ